MQPTDYTSAEIEALAQRWGITRNALFRRLAARTDEAQRTREQFERSLAEWHEKRIATARKNLLLSKGRPKGPDEQWKQWTGPEHVSLAQNARSKLHAAARRENRSVSALIADAVHDYLKIPRDTRPRRPGRPLGAA